MAREGGGGGGGFAWTLLGILVGVAGTLAIETLLSNHHARETAESAAPSSATSASLAIVTAPEAPKIVAAPPVSATPAAAPTTAAQTPSQEDVADDAAAVGMTSRSRPSQDQTDPAPAASTN